MSRARSDYSSELVTTSAKVYPNGVLMSLDTFRLSLIEHSLKRWQEIGRIISYDIQSWIEHSPKNRKCHDTVDTLIENLTHSDSMDCVTEAFDAYLQSFISGEWNRNKLDGQNIVLNVLTEQKAALLPWVSDYKNHWLNDKTKIEKSGANFSDRIFLELFPVVPGEPNIISAGNKKKYNHAQTRLLRSTSCRHYSEVSREFCRDFVEVAYENALGRTLKAKEHFRTGTSVLLRDLAGPPNDYTDDWRAFITPRQRLDAIGDSSAWWVVDPELGNPHFQKWQAIFSAYLRNAERTGTTRTHKAKWLREGLLGWLRTYGRTLSDPDILVAADFVQTGGVNNLKGGLTFEEYILQRYSELGEVGEGGAESLARTAGAPGQLFDYIINNRPHLYGHTRNMVPTRLGQYPGGVTSSGERPSKTRKSILPTTVIEIALEVLTENDAAWPKSQRICDVEVFDPTSRSWVKEYFPGPALLLETLFTLPLRGLQARYLDSGECDEFTVSVDGCSSKNQSPMAIEGRQSGFCQIMSTPLGEHEFSGFRISTNKTGSRNAPGLEEPYDIPWHKEDLLRKLSLLRDWQAKYNPADKLVKRCQLPGDNTPDGVHATEFVFLFRDAGRTKTTESFKNVINLAPISARKISDIFQLLLAEVQKRLLEEEGREVELVTSDSEGNVSTHFTIHALRASLITHFIEAGLPVHIVSEFVVGHANLIMTLYYNKTNPATINDLIQSAAAKLEELDDTPFLTKLSKDSNSSFRDLFILPNEHNRAFNEMEPGLWHTRIDGICPVACTRCHEGMVLRQESTAKAKKHYKSITRNEFSCARCRFNLTGPMFLPGQIVVHTNLIYTLREKARARSKLIQGQAAFLDKGNKLKAAQNSKAISKISDEIDELMVDLSFRTRRISQSIVLLEQAKASKSKNALITGMDDEALDAVLVETSEEALTAMVSECQFFHPETGQGSAPPRHRLLVHKLLSENGYADLLIRLPEDIQHEASVRLTRFLRRKIGDEGVGDLFSGMQSLAELGLVNGFDEEIERLSEMGLDINQIKRTSSEASTKKLRDWS